MKACVLSDFVVYLYARPGSKSSRAIPTYEEGMTMSKIIVTAAITGSIHTPTMTPYLPITPKQIADEVVRSWEAGAAVAHVHVRDRKQASLPPPWICTERSSRT